MVQHQFHQGAGGREAGVATREGEGAEVDQRVVAEVELAQAGQMLEGASAHLLQAAAAEVERGQLSQRRPAGEGAGGEHRQLIAGKEEVAHVGGKVRGHLRQVAVNALHSARSLGALAGLGALAWQRGLGGHRRGQERRGRGGGRRGGERGRGDPAQEEQRQPRQP